MMADIASLFPDISDSLSEEGVQQCVDAHMYHVKWDGEVNFAYSSALTHTCTTSSGTTR